MRPGLVVALVLAALTLATPAAAQWKPGGVVFPITPLDDWTTLLPDGQGGALQLLIPVYAKRELHAQHILANGSLDPLDGANGRVVTPASYGIGRAAAIPDGATGMLATFQRCAFPQPHTPCWETGEDRLVRWLPGGPAPGWPDSGVVIGPTTAYALPLVSGGDGGAIVLIGDALARWTGACTMPWTAEPGFAGVRVSTGTQPRMDTEIAADGSGGAWAAWAEALPGQPALRQLRLNHVSSAGQRVLGPYGLTVAEQSDLTPRSLEPDGYGGVYVAWSLPAHSGGTEVDSVLVQHVDAEGALLWDAPGAPAGHVSNYAPVLLHVVGGDDVALVIDGAEFQPLVQKLSGGAPAWPASPAGLTVGVPGMALYSLCLQRGEDGSMFVAWSDARSGSADPWVTLLDSDGQPAPGWTLAGAALAGGGDDEIVDRIIPGSAPGEVIVEWWRPSMRYPGLSDAIVQKVTTEGLLAVTPVAGMFALAPPWPNPSREGWTVRFVLPAPGEASLELFDVAGRRAWSSRVTVPAPGPMQARIDARGLAEGVYQLRLRSASGERSRALVLLP